MCAAKSKSRRAPEEQLDTAFLHRKELKKRKGLAPQMAWLLRQFRDRAGEGRLFNPLPPNPALVPFDKQSYMQWKALYDSQKITHPRRMRRNSVVIQPLSYSSSDYAIGTIDPQVMLHLQGFCRAFFQGMDVLLVEPVDLADLKKLTKRVHVDTGREQILVDDIMKFLRTHKLPKAFCTVGLTIVDLYPGPQWNFTLGHASLTDGVAVCSFGRYFNSQVMPTHSPHQQQMQNLWILVRVLTHEMCHVFGLKHCHFFNCAMNESSSILQAALQPLFLCPICLRKLQRVLKFDVLGRYQAMAEQCLELFEATRHIPATNELPSSCAPVPLRCPSLQDHDLQLTSDISYATVSTPTTATSMAAMLSDSSYETSDMFSDVSSVPSEIALPPVPCSQAISSGHVTRNITQFSTEQEVLNCPSKHFKNAHEWLQNSISSVQSFLKAVDARHGKSRQR